MQRVIAEFDYVLTSLVLRVPTKENRSLVTMTEPTTSTLHYCLELAHENHIDGDRPVRRAELFKDP